MAGVGGFVQGIAQGLMGGAQMSLMRRQQDLADQREKRIADLMGQQLELQKQHADLQKQASVVSHATALLGAVDKIQTMPDSLRSIAAPTILKAFIDPTTEEGKAFVKAATAMDEEGSAYFKSIVGGMFKSPEVREALSTPKMQQQFRLNPIATLTQLTQLSHANDPKSEAGRQQMDREGLIGRYGADSIEVNNFDRATGQGGPFRGTGLDAQAINILLDPKMDPASPTYRAAYAEIGKPRFDLGSGQMIKPDMSAYRAPGQMTAAGGTNLPAPGATRTSTGGPTVEQIPGFDDKKLKEARAGAATIISSLKDFEKAATSAGAVERGTSLMGGSTGLNTSFNIAALLSKSEELFNLGVLNGPDLDIIRRTLPDPSTPRGAYDIAKTAPAAVAKIERLLLTRLNAKERESKTDPSTTTTLLRGLPQSAPAGDSEIPSPPKGFKVIP